MTQYRTPIFFLLLGCAIALPINAFAAEIPAPDVVSSALSILPADWQKAIGGILMLIGALRLAVKPVVAALHAAAAATGTKVDDDFLARVENSKALKTVLFALDLVASWKPYRGPTSATANPTTPAVLPGQTGGPSAAAGGLVTAIALAGLLCVGGIGCAHTLAPEGVYQGDKALYEADRVIDGAYETLHAFVSWEHENRAGLQAANPKAAGKIMEAADKVRNHAGGWIRMAIATRDAYAANPTGENRTAMQKAISVLREALTLATQVQAENAK